MKDESRSATLAYSVDSCTVARTVAIPCERSTLLVICEVLTGFRRFEDIRVRTAIPRQVLADRLRLLVEHDSPQGAVPAPGQRTRHEYRPTDKGLALYPVVVAMAQWGDRYLADPEGPPLQFEHSDCGAKIDVRVNGAHGPRGERPAPRDPPARAGRASALKSSCTHQGRSTHHYHSQTRATLLQARYKRPGNLDVRAGQHGSVSQYYDI
jgi:DNA-binding HxlR family transcriptional regulator